MGCTSLVTRLLNTTHEPVTYNEPDPHASDRLRDVRRHAARGARGETTPRTAIVAPMTRGTRASGKYIMHETRRMVWAASMGSIAGKTHRANVPESVGGVAAAHGDQIGRTECSRRLTCLWCSAKTAVPCDPQLHFARAVAVGSIQSKSHPARESACVRCTPPAIFAGSGAFHVDQRVPHHAARQHARRSHPHGKGLGKAPPAGCVGCDQQRGTW